MNRKEGPTRGGEGEEREDCQKMKGESGTGGVIQSSAGAGGQNGNMSDKISQLSAG